MVETEKTTDETRENGDEWYIRGNDVVPEIQFAPLNLESDEVRLLILKPTTTAANHFHSTLEICSLHNLTSFVAIKNARGYRKMMMPIEVNGQRLYVSVALERFLRFLQMKIEEPTRIWVRYGCVVESDPQEQAKYWTREFSDTMYARATEVHDMHATNNRQIEEGHLSKLVDSRYMEWRKEWSGSLGEVILPRVRPVRLGTKPSIDAPSSAYQYMPLDMVTDEIRIMCIMPSENADAQIVIHAAHCPIKCEVTFIALSYRWGVDPSEEAIVLNGQKKTIRRNLAGAIRSLRMTDKIVPLWIDALSINQDDLVERAREIRRMGAIYDNAASVYSYVGEAANDVASAFDFVRELYKHPMIIINNLGEFHFGEWGSTPEGGRWYGENRIKPDELVQRCAALYQLLSRQYFRRAWILQEIAWASNPNIFAGRDLSVGFNQLDRASHHLQDMLLNDLNLAGLLEAANPSLKNVDIDMLAFPRKLFYFRHLLSRGESGETLFLNSKIRKTSPGFLEALILARDFECIEPSDHIFALWNVAQDKTGLDFKPDYSQSYQKVYAGFTKAWIAQHQTLDILGAVEFTEQSRGFYEEAPSWCPNWNLQAKASCLVRKDYIPNRLMFALDDLDGKLYSTDGGITRDSFDSPIFYFENSILHCQGIIIDQIKINFEDAPAIPDGTGFPRCDPESYWKFRFWTQQLKEYYSEHELTIYDDPVRAAWAMFHGDNIAAWQPPEESGYESGCCRPDELYVCLPNLSRHVLRYADSYSRVAAWSVVKTVLRGRRPFVSESGYMGLAPSYINGDSLEDMTSLDIAVLAGCSTPLLIREKGDGTYQLLGTCFVQGWMDGEWVQTVMGFENPGEFWEALKDDARLRIS